MVTTTTTTLRARTPRGLPTLPPIIPFDDPQSAANPSLDPRVSALPSVRQALALGTLRAVEMASPPYLNPALVVQQFLAYSNELLAAHLRGEVTKLPAPPQSIPAPLRVFLLAYRTHLGGPASEGEAARPHLPDSFPDAESVHATIQVAEVLGVRRHREDISRKLIEGGYIPGHLPQRAEAARLLNDRYLTPLLNPFVVSDGVFIENLRRILWNYGTSSKVSRAAAQNRLPRVFLFASNLYRSAHAMEKALPKTPAGLGKVLTPMLNRLRRHITAAMVARFVAQELEAVRGEADPRISTYAALHKRFGIAASRAWRCVQQGLTQEELSLRKRIITEQEKGGWTQSEREDARTRIELHLEESMSRLARGEIRRLPTIRALIRQTRIPEDVFRVEMKAIDSAVLERWQQIMRRQQDQLKLDSPRITALAETLRAEWVAFKAGKTEVIRRVGDIMREDRYHFREVAAALQLALSPAELRERQAVNERQTRELHNAKKRRGYDSERVIAVADEIRAEWEAFRAGNTSELTTLTSRRAQADISTRELQAAIRLALTSNELIAHKRALHLQSSQRYRARKRARPLQE